MKPLTRDTFFGGRLKVHQHRDGYRFSIDSVLLAAFAAPRPEDRVVDLGTGCGIVALILAFSHPSLTVAGVEIQTDLVTLARANAAENQLTQRVTVIQEDLRHLHRVHTGKVNMVITNPPYRRAGTGKINPDGEKAAARHEILATLADFIAAGRRLLDIGGGFCLVYPSRRGVDLIQQLRQAGLEPKRLRPVHPYPGAEAGQVLIEAVKGAGAGLHIDAPLILRENRSGNYCPEVAAMLRPDNPPPVPAAASKQVGISSV